jgi:hypothetical protein
MRLFMACNWAFFSFRNLNSFIVWAYLQFLPIGIPLLVSPWGHLVLSKSGQFSFRGQICDLIGYLSLKFSDLFLKLFYKVFYWTKFSYYCTIMLITLKYRSSRNFSFVLFSKFSSYFPTLG